MIDALVVVYVMLAASSVPALFVWWRSEPVPYSAGRDS